VVGGSPIGPGGGYPEELYRLSSELGLDSQVIFTGQIEDVRPALAAMDVFVHPGDPEPFGLVNLEAMAMGLPVVAFSHGALPEIVADGETGLLVQPYEIQALANSIARLLEDGELRADLGRQGRRRVEAEFRIERTARSVEILLEKLLKEKGS
jgi:glycosyltransferase involved in cell wall biosynthesis